MLAALVLLLCGSCDLLDNGPSRQDVAHALDLAAAAQQAAKEAHAKAEELEQKLDYLESRLDGCRCAN